MHKPLIRCLILFFLIGTGTIKGQTITAVYDALSSDNEEKLTKQLALLKQFPDASQQAYRGAMLMKKAGSQRGPRAKLNMFKDGKELLDKEINAHPSNAEFRFLRLIIQENAPHILGYYHQTDEDAVIIANAFSRMRDEVKNAVKDYAAKSKTLKVSDLK
jgi:hypothetical protein